MLIVLDHVQFIGKTPGRGILPQKMLENIAKSMINEYPKQINVNDKMPAWNHGK